MILPIAQIGNPVLRQTAKEITDISSADVKKLKLNLEDTLAPERIGVAIAAPQINEIKRAFLIKYKPDREKNELIEKFVINPQIIKLSDSKIKMWEGCLSIPSLFAEVERSAKVSVKYYTIDGKEVQEDLKGFPARLFLHEFDHLNGILFTDLADPKTLMTQEEYRKMKRR